MSLYERLRHLGVTAPTALGLDTSDISTEKVPLILSTGTPRRRIVPASDQPDGNKAISRN